MERTRLHSLSDILVIALLTMICVGEGWEDMEEFGNAKEEWLRTFLTLPHGIPSADTFRRVLSAVDPGAFNACFVAWAQALSQGTAGKLVAIDGKTVRHSFDKATGKKALHLVSAWVSENRLSLGQLATEDKSNEITAIPKLLGLLDIRGATITVDAMGCQRDIAAKVIDQGADYIMGLKGNQGTAHREVAEYFAHAEASPFRDTPHDFHETVDGSEHGRIEVRRVSRSQDIDWFEDKSKWAGLRSIILVERERTIGTETSRERHYYWSSHSATAETFARMIRGHWGIENELHWCLDVSFGEDQSRMHTDHGAENIAMLRKVAMHRTVRAKRSAVRSTEGANATAVHLAKSERTHKRGIQAKRKLAAWKDAYLLTLLCAGLPDAPAKEHRSRR